jgi:hypothetical protein
MATHHRFLPHLRRAEQRQHAVGVGDSLVLDRPPEEQRDVQVVDVLRPLK